MKVTPSKIHANRANATKSTGPKTPKGKLWSSKNAITHGLLCRSLQFGSPEEEADFAHLLEAVRAKHMPTDPVEEVLVENLAVGLWKKSKVLVLELDQLDSHGDLVSSARKLLSSFPATATFDPDGVLEGKGPLGVCSQIVFHLTGEERNSESDWTSDGTEGKRSTGELSVTFTDGLPNVVRLSAMVDRNLQNTLEWLQLWRDLQRGE